MRLKRFQQQLQKKRITHALFISLELVNPGFVYFTQLPKLTHAALLIPAKGNPTLFVSQLDYGRVRKDCILKQVILLKVPLFKLLKSHAIMTLGVDFPNIPYSLIKKIKKAFPKSRLIDISSTLKELRVTKTRKEIRLMKKAAEIANTSFNKILKNFRFKTEAEVAAALEYEMAKYGASPSFPTIVASGKNASIPHSITSNKPLQKGFCVIDFGANYKGYCSDCTRTLYIGRPTAREHKVYSMVLAAQQKALGAVKPNTSCKTLDTVARTHLKNNKKHFIHALGHGIGIEVHEAPAVSKNSKDLLKKNMVITIEPGIYVPNKFGIRIEDTVVVGNKPKVLTHLSKKLSMI